MRLSTTRQISFNMRIPDGFDVPLDSPRRLFSGDVCANDKPFAFCDGSFAPQDFNANGTVELSVGEDPVSHDHKGLLADFIDDNIFNFGGFHGI